MWIIKSTLKEQAFFLECEVMFASEKFKNFINFKYAIRLKKYEVNFNLNYISYCYVFPDNIFYQT